MKTKRVVFVDFRSTLVALGHMGNCRDVIMDKIKNINSKTAMDILQETASPLKHSLLISCDMGIDLGGRNRTVSQ